MYARLLALLIAFLTLAVGENDDDAGGAGGDDGGGGDGGDAGGTGGDEGGADDAGGDDGGGSLDDMLDADPEPPARQEPDETPRERSARERAENAERQLRERSPGPAPQSTGDAEFTREEEQLRAARAGGANEDQMRWLIWQISANREIRASRRESSVALNEAREIQDRTAFDRLEITKPKTYKVYGKRIEDAIADMKSKGQTPLPRMALLRFFIGDDYMKDALKIKKTGKKETPAAGVPRGKMPSARSDSGARGGGNTERDKRRARLENTQI